MSGDAYLVFTKDNQGKEPAGVIVEEKKALPSLFEMPLKAQKTGPSRPGTSSKNKGYPPSPSAEDYGYGAGWTFNGPK